MAAEKLGSVAEIVMGQSPPGENCNRIGNGIRDYIFNNPSQWELDPERVMHVDVGATHASPLPDSHSATT